MTTNSDTAIRYAKKIWVLIFLCSCWTTVFKATAQDTEPKKAFDFLIGKWKVIEKEINSKDTIFHGTSLYTIYKSHDEATILDDWIYRNRDTVMFKATLLRSYDSSNKRGMLFYADNKYNSQTWEGKLENNEWVFYRERYRDDKKIIIKIKWISVSQNLVQQYIFRSFDEGKSWILGSILDYQKYK